MPRYYFNIVDSVALPDQEGTHFTDLEQVRGEALRLCGETVRELGNDFWDHPEWSLTVVDDAGQTVLAVKLSGVESAARRQTR
ncbi:MAG: hypothetical protein NVS2B5_03080 [Beijerinckiaceae bacterium]